jgi:acetyl esterase
VAVEAIRYEGMIHGFFQMAGVLDQGKRAIEQTAAALRKAFEN